MFVGGVLCFTKTIDIFRGKACGDLKELIGECEPWNGRVPSRE